MMKNSRERFTRNGTGTPLLLALLFAFLIQTGCSEDPPSIYTPELALKGWELQYSELQQGLVDVFFADAEYGWALGKFDTLMKTTDGGATWKGVKVQPPNGGSLTELYFLNRDLGWFVTVDGDLMRTTDGGESWEEVIYYEVYRFSPLTDIFFLNADRGWLTGGTSGNIFSTTDGGETWSNRSNGGENNDQISDIVFVNQEYGWAVGSQQRGDDFVALTLRTIDGGEHWRESTHNSIEGLRDVAFVNTQEGWASGPAGRILHTTNGGQLWTEQSTESGTRVLDLAVVAPSTIRLISALPNVIPAGRNFEVFRESTDGGNTWQALPGTTELQNLITMKKMHFVNAGLGWAVDGRGRIWHTTTGGKEE